MGGSKCSYRNCTVRSGSSKVHMFHFPVYDKNRCHQWLANARKFEFLNLKLSQLRNRIVCQYHFKDDCFMNYKKDKLTFYAVPTEDGPFCEPSVENSESQEIATNIYPLISSENEGDDKYFKKHKSSIIYADFLTNGDQWEKQSLNETIWNNKVVSDKPSLITCNIIDMPVKNEIKENTSISLPKIWPEDMSNMIVEIENPINSDIEHPTKENISDQKVYVYSRKSTPNKIKKSLSNRSSNREILNLVESKELPLNSAINEGSSYIPVSVSQEMKNFLLMQSNDDELINLNKLNASDNIVIEQYTDLKWLDKQNDLLISKNNDSNSIQPAELQYAEMSVPIHEKNTVMETPKDITLQFEPPNNYDLNQDLKGNYSFMPQDNRNQKVNAEGTTKSKIQILFEETITEPIKITDKLEPISPSAVINISSMKENTRDLLRSERRNKSMHGTVDVTKNTSENMESSLQTVQSCKNNEKPCESILKSPAVKHKMSPERIAAIEKKRNFNKKLRDIIETCLEKLDEQDRNNENTAVANTPKEIETKKLNNFKQKVSSYLSKEPELPNVHEYTMKFIEGRMQKMENVLLNKIEQNSQKIVELKKCIVTKAQAHKSSATQTSPNEESYKKQLYQELSKFLSPSANSLVYEELFINKYAQKISNQPSPKRRKRR